MEIPKENTLDYYSCSLLKQALIELGYKVPAKITRKELLALIKDLIQNADDSSEDDLIYKCAYSE